MLIAINNTQFISSAFCYRISVFPLVRHNSLCELVIKFKEFLKKLHLSQILHAVLHLGIISASWERERSELLLLEALTINPDDKIGCHYLPESG